MIWTFAADVNQYFVIARGMCLRTYHDREDHGLPTWRLYLLQKETEQSQQWDSGNTYVGRPGKPPNLDTIWPRFELTYQGHLTRFRPWDDVPWEIHTIKDDCARESAYRAYVGENGCISSETLKRRLIFGLRLAMTVPALVEEIR